MSKPSIVFLTTHSSKGGTLDYIFALKAHFDSLGYTCSIVALKKGADHDPRPQIEVLSAGGGAMSLLGAASRFLRLTRHRKSSVVLGVMPLANVLSAVAATVCRGKAVATHHNPYVTHGRVARALDRMAGAVGMYARVFCVSNSVAQSFDKHPTRYRQSLRVIRNGVTPISASSHAPEVIKRRFGVPLHGAMVLMLGRLSEEKNVLGVIEAIVAVDGVQLVLAGDGPQREACEELIRRRDLGERVHLLGTVSRPDVGELLHAADVFVQVSFYEGNSLALLEAVSARAVLVVSRVPAQVEAVGLPDGSSAAVLCDPASPQQIGDAIRSAAFDETLRQQLRSRVEKLGSMYPSVEEMLSTYASEMRMLDGTTSHHDSFIG
ncbi:glycosyltransferase family 4 protein [Variovorax sp. RCC_210]|uniref:glycosyltransferase family 4 protein n=1 Tax=Variovorax sp. RCC_210 TaxID=3239217 RepID=UPI0035234BC8